MREIGGYIEFESYYGSLYHDKAIPLNCGRNCLVYLAKSRGIKRIYLPYFMCKSVEMVCQKHGIEIRNYHIQKDFRPLEDFELNEDEWLYIVNYYGQLTNDEVLFYRDKYKRVVFDNSQSYFQMPVSGVDTLYSCRKFFGVSDGAFLYTDSMPLVDWEFDIDESFERIHYILGRYERSASEFYQESKDNNNFFENEPVKRMSKLTANLLRSYDYDSIIKKRTANFAQLHEAFSKINSLKLSIPNGAFMYPLYVKNGAKIRKKLQDQKIYIPVLWPDVFDLCSRDDLEYDYAENILPLPVDQRYVEKDMLYMIDMIVRTLSEQEE